MKSANIFLVAVAVFTALPRQSCAAPQVGSAIFNFGGKIGGAVAGKAEDDAINSLGKFDTNARRMNSGVTDKFSGGTEVLLMLDQAAKYIETVKVTLAEFTGKLETVKGATKVKVEEAIAKVAARLEQVESIVVKILKGAGEVTETVEELAVLLAQVEQKIRADLRELSKFIEAIVLKGEEEVSAVVSTAKAIVAKVTKDVDIILSKLSKALKALLAKKNSAVGTTSDEFKSLMAKLIESCNASIARMMKAVKCALATATGVEKEALDKVDRFLDDFKLLEDDIHSDLTEAAISGNRDLLKDLKVRVTNVIVYIEVSVPELLANVKSSAVQAILKEEFQTLLRNDKIVVESIEKLLSGQ